MTQGTFAITTARKKLGFTPSTAVRAGGMPLDVGTGAVIGQAALGGLTLAQEIRKRNRVNLDTLSARQADERRKKLKVDIDVMKIGTPPEKWEEETGKLVTLSNSDIAGFDYSPEEAAKQQLLSDSDLDILPKESLISASRAISAATIKSEEEKLTDAHRLNLPDIAQTKIDFVETMKRNGVSAPAILSKLDAAEKAGTELRNQDAVEFKRNQASLNPDAVITEMEAEKELRKKDEGLPLNENLTNEDLEDIIDFAKSVGEKQETDSKIVSDKAVEDSYSKIKDGDIDVGSMITAIQINPVISPEDSVKAADKIVTFFGKWNAIGSSFSSNNDVYDELTQASEAVERGTMSPADFDDLYAEKKGLLDEDDQRTIRSKDIVATRTMQNRAFTDATMSARPVLIELTESELGSLKLARQSAEIIKDLPRVNMFNIAIKKSQAEQWNFGRFRKALRTQIAQNPDWSQKQIYTVEKTLTDQLDLPVADLLKDFDAANPKSAILKEPPDISFKDIWPDMSLDDRANVWELKTRGASSKAILGELDETKKGPFTKQDFIEQERRDRAGIPLDGPHRRPDGSLTGPGFLGIIKSPNGEINTEISIGVRLEANDGKETDIPTLVPTLNKEEIDYIKRTGEANISTANPAIWKRIVQKAVDHANKRVREGKSVFKEGTLDEELKRRGK